MCLATPQFFLLNSFQLSRRTVLSRRHRDWPWLLRFDAICLFIAGIASLGVLSPVPKIRISIPVDAMQSMLCLPCPSGWRNRNNEVRFSTTAKNDPTLDIYFEIGKKRYVALGAFPVRRFPSLDTIILLDDPLTARLAALSSLGLP